VPRVQWPLVSLWRPVQGRPDDPRCGATGWWRKLRS